MLGLRVLLLCFLVVDFGLVLPSLGLLLLLVCLCCLVLGCVLIVALVLVVLYLLSCGTCWLVCVWLLFGGLLGLGLFLAGECEGSVYAV